MEVSSNIPTITHQIWFQGWDKVPEKFHSNVKSVHDLNPHWTHMQWDEHSLRNECERLGPEYVKTFDQFDRMILKIDFGRYIVLHNYGGVSIDMDMVAIRPLDTIPEVSSSTFIIGKDPSPNLANAYNNATICCCKHNPIMKDILDTIVASPRKSNQFWFEDMYIASYTGPLFVTNVLNQKYTGAYSLLSNEYFNPCPLYNTDCSLPANAILHHTYNKSWGLNTVSIYQLIYTLFFKHWVRTILFICIILAFLNRTRLFRMFGIRRSIFGGLKR